MIIKEFFAFSFETKFLLGHKNNNNQMIGLYCDLEININILIGELSI